MEITSYFHPEKFTAYFGGSITLPCNCKDPQTKPTKITWVKENFGIVYNFTEGYMQPDVHKDYEGRVALVDGSPGNLSLVINDLREEDAGTYTCRNEYDRDDVDLIVQGKLFVDCCQIFSVKNSLMNCCMTELLWLKNNQPVLCLLGCDLAKSGERIEISKLSGESVLLPCWCSEEKAKPKTLKWKDPNGRLIKSYTEQSGRYAPRIEMFNEMDMWNMSLLLSDLTVEDEGVYTCEISATDKVLISLTVTGKLTKTQNDS